MLHAKLRSLTAHFLYFLAVCHRPQGVLVQQLKAAADPWFSFIFLPIEIVLL